MAPHLTTRSKNLATDLLTEVNVQCILPPLDTLLLASTLNVSIKGSLAATAAAPAVAAPTFFFVF